MLQIVHFLFGMPVVYRPHPTFSMQMRLRMLKHAVGKGRHVMKQLHMYASECCNTTVATERAGYVLYRALVMYAIVRLAVIKRLMNIGYLHELKD